MTPDVANVRVQTLSLLISFAVMYNPACDMPTLWIMVRPMDDAAFFIPDILAIKKNTVADLQSGMRGARSMLCVISSVCPDAS